MAGTQSTRGHDLCLLGIPRSRVTITRLCPDHDRDSSRSPGPVDPGNGQLVKPRSPKDSRLAEPSLHSAPTIVARLQPRTSQICYCSISCALHINATGPSSCKFFGSPRLPRTQAEGKRPLFRRSSLVRYQNRPDKMFHKLRTAMHHHSQDQERAFDLSILFTSGPGEFSHVVFLRRRSLFYNSFFKTALYFKDGIACFA